MASDDKKIKSVDDITVSAKVIGEFIGVGDRIWLTKVSSRETVMEDIFY